MILDGQTPGSRNLAWPGCDVHILACLLLSEVLRLDAATEIEGTADGADADGEAASCVSMMQRQARPAGPGPTGRAASLVERQSTGTGQQQLVPWEVNRYIMANYHKAGVLPGIARVLQGRCVKDVDYVFYFLSRTMT